MMAPFSIEGASSKSGAVQTAVSARGTTNLRLHILDDASKGVLTEVSHGVETQLCRLKVIDRIWGRPHKLLERVSVKSIAKKHRVKVTSPTTAAGYLLQVLQLHGPSALRVDTSRDAQRLIAQLTIETRGDGVQLTDADVEHQADDAVEGLGNGPTPNDAENKQRRRKVRDGASAKQRQEQKGDDDEFEALGE